MLNPVRKTIRPFATLTGIDNIDPDDGTFIVGDGTGWVGESGDTARHSLGLGTADTPQFTGALLDSSGTTALTVDSDAGQVGRVMFSKNGAGHWRIDNNANDAFLIQQSGIGPFVSVAAGPGGIATFYRPCVFPSTITIGSVVVNPASPATYDMLAYNGSQFVPKSPCTAFLHGDRASGPYGTDLTVSNTPGAILMTPTSSSLKNITNFSYQDVSYGSVSSGTGGLARFSCTHSMAVGDPVAILGSVYTGVYLISNAGSGSYIECTGLNYSSTDTGKIQRGFGLTLTNAGTYRVSFVTAARSASATARSIFLQAYLGATATSVNGYVQAPGSGSDYAYVAGNSHVVATAGQKLSFLVYNLAAAENINFVHFNVAAERLY